MFSPSRPGPGFQAIAVRAFGAWLLCMLLAFLGLGAGSAHAQSPAAGTAIGNQASATYTDASSASRTVTSNVVTAIVQQVAGLTLTANTSKTVASGSQVSYPLTLTNTGNGSDTYNLSFTQSGAFNFTSVTFYADANGDGVADNTTPITTSPPLAQSSVFRFVAVGIVPATAVTGNVNNLVVTATSTFNSSVSASVTDTTTVTSNAVVNATKTMSATSGNPGSGPHTVTLTYSNTGNTAATQVTLRDVLPSGMTYVAGSARWSGTGSTVLTDASSADAQGSGPTVTYDFGVTAANQATAVISSVAPGQSGTITFQVTIAAFDTGTGTGQQAGTINNTATVAYNDGAANVGPFNTNTFAFTVNAVRAVTMTGATVANATQGSTVAFTNVVRNNGNSSDSFDLTINPGSFPAGTSYALYQADGVSPLLDTNGNGIPDTGNLPSGATSSVVVRVTLPTAATGGPFSFTTTATSHADNAITATASNTLTAIVANSVDLTNGAAIGGAGVVGVGAGPEASAQTTNSTNPGTTTRFTLYVNNTSSVSDTYNLSASTDATFATLTLPTGWTVVFRDASGTVLTNTGVINGGVAKQIFADVTVPANQVAIPAPGQSLYFRVVSPSTGAVDRKHDAVVINTVRSLQLSPNNTGQVFPGASVVYNHTLTNSGNVSENIGSSSVALSLANTQGTFSSIVYRDANSNGVIDATDPVINAPSDLGALAPGATVSLLVRISAASGAAVGTIDTTTLRATTAGAVNGEAAPAVASATDSTTVIAGNLVLLKEHALDANCDGVADTAFGTANISTGAVPGACIRYRITMTNIGTADVLSVVASDATPSSTTYHATVPADTSQGTISAPAGGSMGTIAATVGTIAPSASAVMTFGVRINP